MVRANSNKLSFYIPYCLGIALQCSFNITHIALVLTVDLGLERTQLKL